MDHETPAAVAATNTDAARRRRGRSWAILIVLLGLCALFYAITIVKMAHF
ncbi:MAG: hypothetical protein QOD93_4879 [Acetobacteraceae bacterium]|jgi:hypothetical protein|nr:hypothetical protein [Rhodopila sp.]MEA2729366.1 hypothetical protein [Acetobacteraceae bacterium]MEA2771917.1 hypothetical protein [Acetobacteraceae bacterium]